MALALTDVTFDYTLGRTRVVRALAGVTVSVEPGELVVVVGATGSGKTTLMKLAAGLLKPTTGQVTVDGKFPSAGKGTSGVGLVFQDAESQLFADTLLDDVAFGPRNQGLSIDEAQRRAAIALGEVGLPAEEFGDRSPFSLSGGEARRAAIAGVIAMQPAYLLADEPTSGLDARGRRTVRELLLAQRERAGVVVVTHAAEEFLAHADRLVVLGEGSVTWAGAGSVAVANPRALVDAGLTLPDVLEAQMLAAERGASLASYTLDPVAAAESLAAAARGEG
ncbi:MAG TPA: ATP-binding cassette domain-containing protein [Coriobacteriia bacterium]|nr:ATP-binding cassette domain-containing protein [Coriobacteriia bacterium]